MTMIAPLPNGICRAILSHEAPSLSQLPSLLLNHSSNASTYSITKLCAPTTLRFRPAQSYHSTCQALATPTPAFSRQQQQQQQQSNRLRLASPATAAAAVVSRVSSSPKRPFSCTRAVKMSDEDYLAFLNKANAAPASTAQSSTDKQHFKTVDEGVTVPEVLKKAVRGRVFTAASSEAESPFEVVALKLEDGGEDGGGLPDEETFARMIGHADPGRAKVEIKDPVDWDPEGGNNEVLEAVREAGRGADVRVYEVWGDERGVRVCYFLVTAAGGRVLGVMGEGVFT
ncbi:hypothetical protein QBC41DRAFT_2207 [Cercophora samala]|uniref:Uncharacterized protein n=1 Tax=Cercophora samala TaxID=330535 RepID=A0AA39ZNM9_9PEZI|nr:hypothetical protein QBC41DRAFT_2207 [Cercophora samala]